jgi:phage-related protein
MIGLHRFRYNGYSSQDFDLLCDVSFNEDNGDSESFLNREAVASEVYNGTLRRVHNFKYTDVFAPRISLIKNTFDDFTEDEVRRILSWLTSSATPKFLTAYRDDSEVVSFEILGAPTSIEVHKLTNNRIAGIVFIFESSAPYAFSAIKTVEKDITNPQTFTITCDSDELGALVYPKVTINQSNNLVVQTNKAMGVANKSEHISGTVYLYNNTYYWVDDKGDLYEQPSNTSGFDTTGVLIENITTNSKTTVGGNISQEIVTLDGANRVVTSNRENRIFGNDFNWQWVPLVPGENTITVTGSCTVKFEWREPRKVGF